jgi:hypothetical protein
MKLRHCLFVVVVAIAGCGSSSHPATSAGPDGSSDTVLPADAAMSEAAALEGAAETTAEAASSEAGDDAGPPCNTIANDAPVVNVTQVAADPPTPMGGTIVNGTYWQTSLEIYTGPDGPTGTTGTSQSTALIEGETVQLVQSPGQPARRTITLTTADGGFTSSDTCPDSQSSQGGYTATATTLTIFLPGGTDDAGARTVVETLTKQ